MKFVSSGFRPTHFSLSGFISHQLATALVGNQCLHSLLYNKVHRRCTFISSTMMMTMVMVMVMVMMMTMTATVDTALIIQTLYVCACYSFASCWDCDSRVLWATVAGGIGRTGTLRARLRIAHGAAWSWTKKSRSSTN